MGEAMVFGLGLAALAGWLVRRRLRYNRHMLEFALGFARVQREALEHIGAGATESSLESMLAELHEHPLPLFRTCLGLTGVYSVDFRDGQYVHHISVKAPGRPVKFAMTHMLLVMGIVLGAFNRCGFGEDGRPTFELGQSEFGTQHLEYVMSPEQHARYAAEARLGPGECATS